MELSTIPSHISHGGKTSFTFFCMSLMLEDNHLKTTHFKEKQTVSGI